MNPVSKTCACGYHNESGNSPQAPQGSQSSRFWADQCCFRTVHGSIVKSHEHTNYSRTLDAKHLSPVSILIRNPQTRTANPKLSQPCTPSKSLQLEIPDCMATRHTKRKNDPLFVHKRNVSFVKILDPKLLKSQLESWG